MEQLRMKGVVLAWSLVLASVMACDDQKLSLGEGCLKGEHCLSGVCSAGKCVAPYPIIVGTLPDASTSPSTADARVIDSSVMDASVDPTLDSSSEASADGAQDATLDVFADASDADQSSVDAADDGG